jgi:hypothetical protein
MYDEQQKLKTDTNELVIYNKKILQKKTQEQILHSHGEKNTSNTDVNDNMEWMKSNFLPIQKNKQDKLELVVRYIANKFNAAAKIKNNNLKTKQLKNTNIKKLSTMELFFTNTKSMYYAQKTLIKILKNVGVTTNLQKIKHDKDNEEHMSLFLNVKIPIGKNKVLSNIATLNLHLQPMTNLRLKPTTSLSDSNFKKLQNSAKKLLSSTINIKINSNNETKIILEKLKNTKNIATFKINTDNQIPGISAKHIYIITQFLKKHSANNTNNVNNLINTEYNIWNNISKTLYNQKWYGIQRTDKEGKKDKNRLHFIKTLSNYL